MKSALPLIVIFAISWIQGCQKEPAAIEAPKTESPSASKSAQLLVQVRELFGSIAPKTTSDDPNIENARVMLGKALYFDPRLSLDQNISCSTCHDLEHYGIDIREIDGQRSATSMGHKDALGGRNSPTTYNAFVHVAQFWDGRAKDVEAQAKGPVTNPIEMALPNPEYAVKVLKSIPGYSPMFRAAFPGEKDPISYDNFARAVGAFERKLVTPAPVDKFLAGDVDALTTQQVRGFTLFAERCVACHMGPGFGGAIFQKLGLLKPYPTKDEGRYEVTQDENDRQVFKVPSLRNIAQTGPYLHDGSIKTLEGVVALMAEYQTPQGKLTDGEVKDIRAFLDALTGELPNALIEAPALPPNGPNTPTPKTPG